MKINFHSSLPQIINMIAKKTTKKPSTTWRKKEEVKQELVSSAPVDDTDFEEVIIDEAALKSDRYFQSVGRRKTAVARIRLYTKGDKEFLVNSKPYQTYFSTLADQETAVASMKKMKCLEKFRVVILVKGGGHSAQAEAVRHGTARVLVSFNQNFRKRLSKAGLLTRDSRQRERKKFGLKRARKSPQWAKR